LSRSAAVSRIRPRAAEHLRGDELLRDVARSESGRSDKMMFSHAQNTLGWDDFAFAEPLMTMVVIDKKVGAFGAYHDGMEIYGRATASKDGGYDAVRRYARR
jgi:hypothetical protein